MVRATYYPFSTAPAPYDVVWCNFPLVEEPYFPAPKARPALVRQAFQDQDGNPWVHVVYGTSKRPYSSRPQDFAIVTLPEMEVCGLSQATRFELDRQLELPWSEEYFGCLPGQPTPVIGHVPDYEVRKLQMQVAYWQRQIAEDED